MKSSDSRLPYVLHPMTLGDLELVRSWRNRPEVRENMFSRHEITAQEHRAYFERVFQDPTKRYFICSTAGGEAVGAVNFTQIDPIHHTAMWGFYTSGERRKGVGTWMAFLALDFAFHDIQLFKVSGDVLDWNDRSLVFHERLGFRTEGVFRSQHVRGDQRHDVHRMGLLRFEWEVRRDDIAKQLRRSGGVRESGSTGPDRKDVTLKSSDVSALSARMLEEIVAAVCIDPTTVRSFSFEALQSVPTGQRLTLTTHVFRAGSASPSVRATLVDGGGTTLCRMSIEANAT